jgi:hypothetical protein
VGFRSCCRDLEAALGQLRGNGNSAKRWLAPTSVLCVYGLLLTLTASADPGDTRDYAKSIAERFAGRNLFFWESGHLLWRPLGYLVVLATHPTRAGISSVAFYADIVHALIAINVAMGAVTLLAFLAWAQRMGVSRVAAVGATIAMALTCACLNFAQSGTSYIPALAMLAAALWALAVADDRASTRAVVPALFLAESVLLWLPMVLVVPVAAVSQIVLRGDGRRRRIAAVQACLMSGIVVIAAYLIVASIAGVRSFPDFRVWMSESAHGIQNSGGVMRAAIGLARSFVSMEQLGITAKRHMLGDPYNPAAMADVARAGLYRVALFYVALGALVLALARHARQRRALAFLGITAVPVLAFAVAWQGGDPERYLVLYPAMFLAFGVALSLLPSRAAALSAAAVIAIMSVANVPAYSRGAARRTCEILANRLGSIPMVPGKPALLVTLGEDELTSFRGRCPDAPILETAHHPGVIALVAPHSADATEWRRMFADRALQTWHDGGRVWISNRAFSTRPASEWNWAEGDDPRLHWRDFPAFFGRLAHGELGSGGDAFVEILQTVANASALDSVPRPPK